MQTEIEVQTIEKPAPVAQNEQLERVLSESGLQLTEAEQIKQSYLPYFEQMAEIKELARKVNFENPTDLDEKIARDLRLRTAKIRTGSEALKVERKRIHLLKGNVEQSAWNLIKSTCELDEELFLRVEKYRENKRIAAEAALQTERNTELRDYAEFVPQGLNLGAMTETDFANLLNGAKLQKQAKIAAEAEAERQRIERETAEAATREAQRKENERLRAENAAKEKQLEAERATAAAEKQKQQAILDAERKKSDDLLAAKNKQIAADKAAKDKAEAEAKSLRDAEAKRIADAKAKADADRAAELESQRKAAAAPDKEKLTAWVNSWNIAGHGEISFEAVGVRDEIVNKFTAFKAWAVQQINTL